jgi:hypothetical protein
MLASDTIKAAAVMVICRAAACHAGTPFATGGGGLVSALTVCRIHD